MTTLITRAGLYANTTFNNFTIYRISKYNNGKTLLNRLPFALIVLLLGVLSLSAQNSSDTSASKIGIDLKDPPNIVTTYQYDPTTGKYLEILTVGGRPVGSPRVLTMYEYMQKRAQQEEKNYFRQKAGATNYIKGSGIVPPIHLSPPIFDKVFGGGIIDIRPTGSAEVTFGGKYNRVENPNFTTRQQRNGQFDFGMKMQLNVTGQIGDRLKLNWNYDTEATFEFENQMKLNWGGTEDDIVKNIELGNVSLPLNGSLIQGGQNLFGIKTQLQFGKMTVTAIATQQKGETRETEVNGGAQITNFDIQASSYDVNRHFFLSQFFANQYDQALSQLPVVQSNVLINFLEVWVTNRSNVAGNTRNVVGFMDLGEANTNDLYRDDWNPNNTLVPDNAANELFSTVKGQPFCDYTDSRLVLGTDYECLNNARQLTTNDYTFNDRLGYISLNQSLNNDEVLMVAFEYTYNGRRYQVGEFTVDNPSTANTNNHLLLKLIKPTTVKTNLPTWDLMMKNVYSLNTYNLQTEDFTMNIVYADDPSGADLNYLPVKPTETQVYEKQLIEVLNLDEVNKQMEAKPDGVFDLIEGITVNTLKGRIIFPVREPFGSYLRDKFTDPSGTDAEYYAFDALYDSTRWLAEQDVKKNKFFLRGTFKGSATDEIRLQCYNISQGSVRVTANGNVLNEGGDYTVDYTLGTVRIINQGILNSGAVIKATCESNSLINIQQKSLVGARFDYKHSEKLLLGGTFMHMTERPLTPKVNIGEEPILNSIWGIDGTYHTESRFLTKMVDKLPFIETKAKSTISFTGEFAHLIPHKPRTMGDRGTSYLDDFEGAETPYDLKYFANWKLATMPQGQPDLFPESQFGDSAFNTKRANLAWYSIDPIFQSSQNLTPDHLKNDTRQRSNHFVRSIPITEVFPRIEQQQGQPSQLPTLDLAYYPKEKGQYNFNTTDLQADGTLANPEENWGGIMRRIETNDFEATNIDYIEIWMMDPFVYAKYNNTPIHSGDLYINLGSVSEDLISDRRRSVENGLPTPSSNIPLDTSYLSSIPGALIPAGQVINKAFDNDPSARGTQDVGYDGMNDAVERSLRVNYLNEIEALYGTASVAYQQASNDPSNDNYRFYRDELYDANQSPILERYKKYNGVDGNSTLDKLNDGTPKSGNNKPDDEDINADHTINMVEEYYQYRISIDPANLKIGSNFVTDTLLADASQEDQGEKPNQVYWYQLKIPVRQYERKVGGIQDFKSIRFMRMYLKGFEDSVILRFANLQLVRADWRRYLSTLKFPPTVGPPVDPDDDSKLVVSTVNIVENSRRDPVNYIVPPGFTREIDPTQVGNVQQNEQSLSIAVCELAKGDAKGAFRTMNYDIRNYKSLAMFIHAESEFAKDGDVVALIRIGTDLENNFYQYEIPLTLTPAGSSAGEVVWPELNELNIELEEFYRLKLNRELSGASQSAYYSETLENGHKISIIGLPDLSNVRTILLGVKNSENSSVQELCSEVWFNEFRLVDFVNKGGYAANARLVTKLADFATVTLAGNYQSIGFGAIDKKLNERNLNEMIQYDISSNIELGKFFPQKSGITIPMFIGYNENIINPKFYPLNPDILLRTAVDNAETQTEKDAIKEAAQDYTSRYSLNFTNVKKNRTSSGLAHFYDIENWNYSIAYQRIFRRNQIIEYNEVKTYKSSLGYNFAKRRNSWEPFKKTKMPMLIRDFNLTFLPSNFNFRFDVNRRYSETKNRNNDNFKAIVPTLYDKTFGITRVYGWKWNIARSLTVDYASTAIAWVEEPIGALDTEAKLDTIRRNFFNMGRLNNFNQNINVNYNLPLRKIKYLDWVTVTTRYSAGYQWRTAPPARNSLGNTIQNSRTLGVNGNLNFISFYNKFPFLLKINRPPPKRPESDDPDADDADKEKEISPLLRASVKALMMLKQAQISINVNDGTTVPGFVKSMDFFGQNFKHQVPGFPFILGSQDENIRYDFARNGDITTDTVQNSRYIQLNSLNINGSATIEPFSGFRISINFNKRQSISTSSNFRYSEELGLFQDYGLTEVATFSTSYGMWATMFDKLEDLTYQSDVFDQFKNNRYVIAQRLQVTEFTEGRYASTYGNEVNSIDTVTGFPLGFSQTHQDVLLYSFLAAYSGKNASTMTLTQFQKIPIPNWRITYNGLSRLDIFKDLFSNISLSHAYSSTLNLGSFFQPLDYGTDTLVYGENLVTQYGYQSGISLVERLTPLLGIDVTTTDGLTLRFEYKFDRNLTLNLRNLQMVEVRNKEYVIGIGFRTTGMRLPFKYNGDRVVLRNDLNMRFDFSIRDGLTVVRNIETDIATATAGIKTVSIKPTIDYKINDNLNFRMFYNRNINTPVTSNSFPTALTDFGITLRYSMQ